MIGTVILSLNRQAAHGQTVMHHLQRTTPAAA
jgi:hypothetical protein